MMNVVIFTSIFILMKTGANCYELHMPLYNPRALEIAYKQVSNLALQHHITAVQKQCHVENELKECLVYQPEPTSNSMANNLNLKISRVNSQVTSHSSSERTAQMNANPDKIFRRMIDSINSNMNTFSLHGKLNRSQSAINSSSVNSKLNMKLDSLPQKKNVMQVTTVSSDLLLSINSYKNNSNDVEITTADSKVTQENNKDSTTQNLSHDVTLLEKFSQSLDIFERKFYERTFSKLLSISPATRRENGMSYVQSGLFLHLALMALSTEVGPASRREIDDCLRLDISDQEKLELINVTMSSLPVTSEDLKFRWSTRLVLRSVNVSERFRATAAKALRLKIDSFNGTETPKEMAVALNHMVEEDSGGAIHNTFDEEELSSDVRAVLVSTLYLRARWRSAPTLLNGTHTFRDTGGAHRATRMIRVNDHMRYAALELWDADALEIFYSTPGLSLLLLVPRGTSLRQLVAAAVNTSLCDITARMRPMRVAATLPLYTLRMTLLLPNKLQAMNLSHLVESNGGPGSDFQLSLAVQRIMFWAEAGRNAFKDDGLDWDEPPQQELIVDRPYIFYVRWKNKTIMNGNFVL